jgi:hypothetical protein
LALIRYEANASLGLALLLLDEVNLSDDLGLFALRTFFVHLFEDVLRALLIDSDLGLYDHVVNQSDKSAKTAIVAASELQNLIFEQFFLLHEDH